MVQIVTEFLGQDDCHRFAVGRGHPVGIEVNGGFTRGACCRKRTSGALQFGGAAQLHAQIQLALIGLRQKLIYSRLPLRRGLLAGLLAIEQGKQLFANVRAFQKVGDQLLGACFGLCQ